MDQEKPNKHLSHAEALEKLRHYCAYQERCHKEVRYKLIDLGIYGDDLEQIIVNLVEDGFLDEERYARAYARGKLRNNHWGFQKIRQALKQKGISSYNLMNAEEEFMNEDFRTILLDLLLKKKNNITRLSHYELRQKLFQYAYSKGYDTTSINSVLDEVLFEP